VLLRAGSAGSNTVADHIAVIGAALAQLPSTRRPGKNVLIRVDGAGGTHGLIEWLTRRRLAYSVGFPLPGDLASIQKTLAAVPTSAWTPAYDADDQVRPGAWVAEVTDCDGQRITAFVTNTKRGQLADLELRHRRQARAEDRIRAAKDSGLANLPLHDFASNQIWCAIVTLAADLLAWMQTLALTEHPAAGGSPSGCACGCSPSPGASRSPPGDACCTWPPPPRSPTCCSTRCTGSTRWPRPADRPRSPSRRPPLTPGSWTPATTPTTQVNQSHPEARITGHSGQEPDA
jgi:hypothetical protein